MRKRDMLFLPLLVLAFLIFVGTFLYTYIEGWGFIDSLYFVVMGITTVGYGDLVPTHDLSKIITIIYSLVSIPLMLLFFGLIAEVYFEKRIRSLENILKKIVEKEDNLNNDMK